MSPRIGRARDGVLVFASGMVVRELELWDIAASKGLF